MKKNNDNKYDFNFESIYDIEETRNLFFKFLEKEKNCEPFLFLKS
jgi:hypothetical protein